MSLFGGDGSASQTQSQYDSESDLDFDNALSPIENPSVVTLQGTPNLQHVQSAQTTGSLDNESLGTNSEAEADEVNTEEFPVRLNRFVGPPQTWKVYTAADRQIATSLNQIEETDLAAHLYNAHALKRRVRKSANDLAGLHNWQSKDVWLKKGTELEYMDAVGQVQTELIPSKDWTAWPLPPAQLFTQPDKLTRTAGNQGDGQWAIGGADTQDPGRDLREETLGLFLRLAKDNWRSKAPQDRAHGAWDHTTHPRARSRSKSVRSMRSQTDVEMKDKDDSEADHQYENQLTGPKRGRKPQSHTYAKPVVLADDAKAMTIVQPTIHSLLGQLDDVAMAVRRTRLNHFRRGASSDMSSQSEFTSDAESIGPGSRSSSKQKSLSDRKKNTRRSMRPSSKAEQTAQRASDHQTDPQDSDSASEYEEPSATTPMSQYGRKRSRSESTADEEDAPNTRDWSGRAGLMDWSEVLGIAAIKGWNERAIARTAQRCAALFGESMSFATLDESLATKPSTELTQYTPTTIPAPETGAISIPKFPKRPLFQIGTLRCPHKGCYGNEKEFALPYRVVEHCMRVHGYDPRSNDPDNEERTIGGVHIDGFLQPITAKQGWLGHGRSKTGGKKRKIQHAKQNPDTHEANPDVDTK
jgi:hypothetical protein